MATTWFAIIDEGEFPQFVQRVRGLGASHAAYLAKLDRHEADWMAAVPDGEAIRVRVSVADLDKYCHTRGGRCAAHELTWLANLKQTGRL